MMVAPLCERLNERGIHVTFARLRVLFLVVLLASIAANGFLVWLARELYRDVLRVRLDPTSAATFVPMNSAQPSLPAGHRRIVFVGDSRTEMWRSLPSIKSCQMVNRGKSH